MGNQSVCPKDHLEQLREPITREQIIKLWSDVFHEDGLNVAAECPHCGAGTRYEFPPSLMERVSSFSLITLSDHEMKRMLDYKCKICKKCKKFTFSHGVSRDVAVQVVLEISKHLCGKKKYTPPKRSRVEELLEEERDVFHCVDVMECVSVLFRSMHSILDTWLISYDAHKVCHAEDTSIEHNVTHRLEQFYEKPREEKKAYDGMTREQQRAHDDAMRRRREEEREVVARPSEVEVRHAAALAHMDEVLAKQRQDEANAPKPKIQAGRNWGNQRYDGYDP